MANFIVMPRLSPTMEEGVLAKWLKKEGDKIAPGDVIAEVETDKANMDFPLEDEGVLLKLLVPEGATIKLGAPVGILGKKGEDISQLLAEAQGTAKTVPTQAKTGSTPAIAPQSTATGSQPEKSSAPSPTSMSKQVSAPVQEASTGRILASPLAKRIASDAGLPLSDLQGSGPKGRIVKRDIEHALTQTPMSPKPTSMDQNQLPRASAGEVVPMSMMRKTIAKRLTEAKQTVPHFYLTTEANVEALWRLREQINQTAEGNIKISVNDLIIKATARALKVWPQVNMSYSEQGAVSHPSVDVGVAVALPDGLLTPIVRQASQKSVGIISAEIRDLAERGRQKKLRPEEYQGATFTVSNLGMFGIREFFAIINPPESGILAVGKIEKRPIVMENKDGDAIVIQRCLILTLSCDHRIVDGALGAQFLAEIKKGLENPWLLVL